MLTYTAAQLKVLDFDDPPPRPVRRTLFTFHLWRRAGTTTVLASAGVKAGMSPLPGGR